MSARPNLIFMRMSNLKVLAAVLVAALGLMSIPSATGSALSIAQPPAQSKPPLKTVNFFMHDDLLEPVNPSAFFLLQPLAGTGYMTNPDVNFFGAVAVFDDSMTVNQDESSLEVGRGRGFYVFDQNITTTPGLEYVWTAIFNEASGFTPGSTLTFKGYVVSPFGEIAIVGGTGDFRMAFGWAEVLTVTLTALGATNLNITCYFQQYGY